MRKRLARSLPGEAAAPKARPSGSAEISGALGRGLAILKAFRFGDSYLGNAEFAERLGLPKATISRLTQTLSELGFLKYVDSVGKYELTPAVLAGYAVLSRSEIHMLARPLMVELSVESGMSVGLGVRDGLDMVIIEYALGHYATGLLTAPIGGRIPLAETTMGWACLYSLSAMEQSDVFKAIRASHPDDGVKAQTRILQAHDEISQRGFCMGLENIHPRTIQSALHFFTQMDRQSWPCIYSVEPII